MPRDRQTLFFSATLEGAAGKLAASYTRDARRHVHPPKVEKARRGRAPLRPPAPRGQGRRAGQGAPRRRARPHPDLRPHQARRRPPGPASSSARRSALAMHGNKSQSQRRRALASFERGRLRHTGRHRRGLARHRRRRHHPRDQLRRPRTATPTCTARAAPAALAPPGSRRASSSRDQHREMRKIATDLGLHREFDAGPGFEHAARRHSGNGGASGKSFNGRPPRRRTQRRRSRSSV